MTVRWITYQRERFPLVAHLPLVALITLCALAFSAPAFPPAALTVAAIACTLLLFFELRVLDEFKDYADDLAHRPYRPVPRGLVTLRELGQAGLAAAAVQLLLTVLLRPQALGLLLLVWAYMGLMAREFFVPAWLKARPLPYLLSHLAVVPLIVLFASSWAWLPGPPPERLGGLLLVSLLAGALLELGRKLRAPGDEEAGVQTYSALWGLRRALAAWLALAAAGVLAAALTAQSLALLAAGAAAWLLLLALARRAALEATRRRVKPFELFSALWIAGLYLGLGVRA
ncbi:4-hydroxybenzoate polyprenyltransferase [Deinobacterium chartae]|uniref:4-hydroxybenzoate polyprenyltransferase n=1 Tax=Deinobacterium chartae TaxID=521158 RepID=A0A841I2L5_9DEIO|nr:UbiA family prenyltransferase [Deinobacterium chartae]MBB6099513.1 4-hydroxybenzoate polyprenyltransferase [Deinobacterium chartae]